LWDHKDGGSSKPPHNEGDTTMKTTTELERILVAGRPTTVSREQAVERVEELGCDLVAFYADLGYKPTYNVSTVLRWLGY
jgi:hypothetical protein